MNKKMKKALSILLLLVAVSVFVTGCSSPLFENGLFDGTGIFGDLGIFGEAEGSETLAPIDPSCDHADGDDDGECDSCHGSLIVVLDFYAINDLHGKFKDTSSNVGVDELTTFLKLRRTEDTNVVLLSSGDMWQGSSESNLTKGLLITDWMNELGFSSMTLGNHEYDWGEEFIEANDEIAEFPFLAINAYDRDTNMRVDYCDASVVVEKNGIEIGIIGALGDCYSSIASDKSGGFYIKTGSELTSLVKAESERLRAEGVDYIVYSIHDGYGRSSSGDKKISSSELAAYYDSSLSDGYVDLVFEGHTHQSYVLRDDYGVYHLQNGGDNKGISHVEIGVNLVTGSSFTREADFLSTSIYANLSDDAIVATLLEKYKEQVSLGDVVLGNNSKKRDSVELLNLTARLYYEYGIERWGEQYDIVLGGAFLKTRSPYDLAAGEVKYADIQQIMPFDNNLVLCSISGYDLKNKFLGVERDNYYIYYGSYGEELKNNIDTRATYYIITDTYTSTYSYNNLTEIERVGEEIFARDLIAKYIKSGSFN